MMTAAAREKTTLTEIPPPRLPFTISAHGGQVSPKGQDDGSNASLRGRRHGSLFRRAPDFRPEGLLRGFLGYHAAHLRTQHGFGS